MIMLNGEGHSERCRETYVNVAFHSREEKAVHTLAV